MEPNEVITYVFYGAMTLIAGYLSTTLTKLRESIEQLNVNMAVEINNIANVKETLAKYADIIAQLERRLTYVEMNQAANQCGKARKD